MKPSEQLEREAERRRTDVASNITELRERLRPGRLTDDVLSYAGNQTGELLNTFGKQVAANPVPALLIGAGIAWLAFGGGRERSATAYRGNGYDRDGTSYRSGDSSGDGMLHRAADSVAESASDLYDKAASAVGSASDKAASTASALGDKIAGAARTTAQKASELGSTVADTTRRTVNDVKDSATGAAQSAMRGGKQAMDATTQAADDAWLYLKDQPLLLMGIGLAIGSLMGTAIPRTKFEDRLMGDTSDDIKDRAEDLLSEGLGEARDLGEKVLDAAADQTKAHLSSDQNQPAFGTGGEREPAQDQNDMTRRTGGVGGGFTG